MEQEKQMEFNTSNKEPVKRSTYRFKGEHGIYLLFSSAIIEIVAKESNLTPREVRVLLFGYYVSKYIAFSAVLIPDLISTISAEVNMKFSSQEIHKLLPKLYELKYVAK
jgi:hypothetical protein